MADQHVPPQNSNPDVVVLGGGIAGIATAVELLMGQGAVMLGKGNMDEFAMGSSCENSAFHPTRNPWDLDRVPGGSSGGAAASVAAGETIYSLGSDTGGSVRQPAALCGVVGLKPTYGLVSRFGVIPNSYTFDHCGPMTWTVEDSAIMLQAIAGHDPNDPTSLPGPMPDIVSGLDQGISGVRVGLDESYVTEEVDTEVAQAVLAGIAVLNDLGAEIVPVQMPDTKEYVAAWAVLCSAEAVAAHHSTYPARRDEYGPWFRGWLDKGAEVTGSAYAQANNVRDACNGLLRAVFEDIDVLVCPSMTTLPGRVTPQELCAPMTGEDDFLWGRFTVPFDFNGAPTISLPCGLSSEGLPLSIQFVGKPLDEPLLCRLGHAYEQATQWHQLRPDV